MFLHCPLSDAMDGYLRKFLLHFYLYSHKGWKMKQWFDWNKWQAGDVYERRSMSFWKYLGNRIVPTSTPWMASEESFNCKVQPFYRAVLAQCSYGVCRAGWGKSACRGFERRYADLVEAYQKNEWSCQNWFKKSLQLVQHCRSLLLFYRLR